MRLILFCASLIFTSVDFAGAADVSFDIKGCFRWSDGKLDCNAESNGTFDLDVTKGNLRWQKKWLLPLNNQVPLSGYMTPDGCIADGSCWDQNVTGTASFEDGELLVRINSNAVLHHNTGERESIGDTWVYGFNFDAAGTCSTVSRYTHEHRRGRSILTRLKSGTCRGSMSKAAAVAADGNWLIDDHLSCVKYQIVADGSRQSIKVINACNHAVYASAVDEKGIGRGASMMNGGGEKTTIVGCARCTMQWIGARKVPTAQ